MTDFFFEDGDLKVGADIALTPDFESAVRQKIIIELKTILGEWFLDQNKGLPYFSEIIGKKPNKPYLATLLSAAINKIAEVKKVVSLEVDFSPPSRAAIISFELLLHSGNTLKIAGLEAPNV